MVPRADGSDMLDGKADTVRPKPLDDLYWHLTPIVSRELLNELGLWP